jgi:hypothetical protein
VCAGPTPFVAPVHAPHSPLSRHRATAPSCRRRRASGQWSITPGAAPTAARGSCCSTRWVGGARDLAHATIDDASWPPLRPLNVSFSTNETKVVAPCYTLSHTCALPPGGVAVRRRSGRLPLAGDALWCAGSAHDVAAADAGRDGVRQHTVATTLMTRVHAAPWPHLVDRGALIGGRDS